MFDKLTQSFQKVFQRLRGYGRLSEGNVEEALREVRLALLEADVNYQVARDFMARVKAKAVGQTVLESVTPGQQFIKIVHDEMTALLGGRHYDFDLAGRPVGVMLMGLHGSGKTTTAGKLARQWKQQGRQVVLVACDIRRPMAVEQLEILARQTGVGFVGPLPGETVPALGARALTYAKEQLADIIVYDTGGRLQIDTELVRELKDLRSVAKPKNTILVLDAAIGQESVHVAKVFNEEVGLTGLILSKLDGDARGGAALSVQAVTGCPIIRTGMGEKVEDLQPFYPDRMASRILGMGDIVGLVEKAQQTATAADMVALEKRLRKNVFNLEDFLGQLQQMKKMGELSGMLDMLPGGGALSAMKREELLSQSSSGIKKAEAIIQSMTMRERRKPDVLDASRRRRIAAGSGTQVSDVNELLRNFAKARDMAKRMGKLSQMLSRSKGSHSPGMPFRSFL